MSNSLLPYRLQPARLLCSWNSPGKNTRVGCYFLLQGIFPTQGLNLGLLYCKQTSPSKTPGKPICTILVINTQEVLWNEIPKAVAEDPCVYHCSVVYGEDMFLMVFHIRQECLLMSGSSPEGPQHLPALDDSPTHLMIQALKQGVEGVLVRKCVLKPRVELPFDSTLL